MRTQRRQFRTQIESKSGPIPPSMARSLSFVAGVEDCSRRCPIRGIRGIGSLMTQDCALRGRVQARVIPETGVVVSAAEFIAPIARRTVVRSCRQRRTHLTNATNGAADNTSSYSTASPRHAYLAPVGCYLHNLSKSCFHCTPRKSPGARAIPTSLALLMAGSFTRFSRSG